MKFVIIILKWVCIIFLNKNFFVKLIKNVIMSKCRMDIFWNILLLILLLLNYDFGNICIVI